jgi:hypothetical protein
MMEYRKKLGTIVGSEATVPVAYDRSIIKEDNGTFTFLLRVDAHFYRAEGRTLKEARSLLGFFPPEVYEGPNQAPHSVFYPVRGN